MKAPAEGGEKGVEMLKEKLQYLAELRKTTELRQGLVETMFEAVKQSPLYQEYKEEAEAVERLQQEMKLLRSQINALTLEAYQQTGEKKPAPGVGIRIYTNYVYDPDLALEYCRADLPAALKLDKRKFEKFVKGVQDVQPLDFVEVEEDPRPTISSDLSEYLEKGE